MVDADNGQVMSPLAFIEGEVEALLMALAFAARKHCDQRRKGKYQVPYINHLIQVTELLWRVGQVRDVTTLVAALLHDVLEDTATKPEELAAHFGPSVLALVNEVTDDKSLPKAVRKARQIRNAPHCSREAKLIKLADKLQNLSDLGRDPPVGWSSSRLIAYVDWSEQVIAGLRGVNPALESAYDQVASEVRMRLVTGLRSDDSVVETPGTCNSFDAPKEEAPPL